MKGKYFPLKEYEDIIIRDTGEQGVNIQATRHTDTGDEVLREAKERRCQERERYTVHLSFPIPL